MLNGWRILTKNIDKREDTNERIELLRISGGCFLNFKSVPSRSFFSIHFLFSHLPFFFLPLCSFTAEISLPLFRLRKPCRALAESP